MDFVHIFTIFALIGPLILAQTVTDEDEYYPDVYDLYEDTIIHTSDHDIVKLVLPTNALNFDENHNLNKNLKKPILFFVEADIDSSGKRIDQGLYVLKDGKATKLLEHGRDADASGDNSNLVFFGAQDGLYVYNQNTNSAEKYGPITDSIIGVAKEKQGDVIYILTENHELYKVSNNGATKEKVQDVPNAQQIVIDNSNNIYFYTDDKQVFVRTADGVKKIEGIPEHLTNVILYKPPSYMKNVVFSLVGNTLYGMFANGTSRNYHIKPVNKDNVPVGFVEGDPTYFAIDKMIFEVSIVEGRLLTIAKQLDEFLTNLVDTVIELKGLRDNAARSNLPY